MNFTIQDNKIVSEATIESLSLQDTRMAHNHFSQEKCR